MNKWIALAGGAAILMLIIAAALIPIRRGARIHCVGSTAAYDTRMKVRGLPFGYSATTGDDRATCMSASDPIYAYHPVPASFEAASIWFDLIVYGSVMLGAFALIDKVRARHE